MKFVTFAIFIEQIVTTLSFVRQITVIMFVDENSETVVTETLDECVAVIQRKNVVFPQTSQYSELLPVNIAKPNNKINRIVIILIMLAITTKQNTTILFYETVFSTTNV